MPLWRRHRLEEVLPGVEQMGPWIFNLWRDDAHPRGIYRRATLEEFRKAEPAWETVLDIDALAKREDTPWVFHGMKCLPPEYQKCLVSLSPGGGDADEVREFDPEALAFVPDGYFVPTAKTSTAWRDADSLFIGTDFGPGSLTDSGYPRQVRLWSRGTPRAHAPVLFESKPESVGVNGYRLRSDGGDVDLVADSRTFWETDYYQLLQDGSLHRLELPTTARIKNVSAGRLIVRLHDDWQRGDRKFPRDSILLADPGAMTRFAEHEVVLPIVVVSELESKRHHPELGFFAREALRRLALVGLSASAAVRAPVPAARTRSASRHPTPSLPAPRISPAKRSGSEKRVCSKRTKRPHVRRRPAGVTSAPPARGGSAVPGEGVVTGSARGLAAVEMRRERAIRHRDLLGEGRAAVPREVRQHVVPRVGVHVAELERGAVLRLLDEFGIHVSADGRAHLHEDLAVEAAVRVHDRAHVEVRRRHVPDGTLGSERVVGSARHEGVGIGRFLGCPRRARRRRQHELALRDRVGGRRALCLVAPRARRQSGGCEHEPGGEHPRHRLVIPATAPECQCALPPLDAGAGRRA